MILQVKKLQSNITTPTRFHNSAGYDLYSPVDISLPPFSITKIHLGFATAFPPGYVGHICDRSSMGKKGIHIFGGIIDSDYRGEWAVLLYNSQNKTQDIIKNDRIAQVLFYSILGWPVEEVDELEITNRGTNGFGSTGK